MLAAGSGTEAKTVCGWRRRRATYGNSVVELDRIVASAIPAVNKTTLDQPVFRDPRARCSASVISRRSQTNYVCFRLPMAFTSKLNTLAEVEGLGRVPLTDLTDADGYRVIGARTHSHTSFGPSVIITIQYKGEEAICFLLKRHALSLSPPKQFSRGPLKSDAQG